MLLVSVVCGKNLIYVPQVYSPPPPRRLSLKAKRKLGKGRKWRHGKEGKRMKGEWRKTT
jgi:hypothetical protein